MLLKVRADIEAKARYNLTVLHTAAFIVCKSVVQQLRKRGADVKAEAQSYRAEGGEKSKIDAVYTAEKSLRDLLQYCRAEGGEEYVNGMVL
jgi:hypothetical protein